MTSGARHAVVGRPIVHTRFTDRTDGDLFVGLPAEVLGALNLDTAWMRSRLPQAQAYVQASTLH